MHEYDDTNTYGNHYSHKLTVATLVFEADSYTIMEAVGTLMPNILVLDSTLPQEANITVNVSTISGSARSESNNLVL